MKTAYLVDADQATVSAVAVEFLKERGALVTEHTHSHARFVGLNPGNERSFPRGGYVGAYRHAGESEVEVRLRISATGPARVFWGVVLVDLIAIALLFAFRPSGTVWVSLGALLYAAFLAALVLYAGTWRSTRHLEQELFAGLVEALESDAAPEGGILTEEDIEAREFEESLEGELTEAKLKLERKSAPPTPKPIVARSKGSGLKSLLGRSGDGRAKAKAKAKADTPAESPEEKRARLEALRAELERKKREGGGD